MRGFGVGADFMDEPPVGESLEVDELAVFAVPGEGGGIDGILELVEIGGDISELLGGHNVIVGGLYHHGEPAARGVEGVHLVHYLVEFEKVASGESVPGVVGGLHFGNVDAVAVDADLLAKVVVTHQLPVDDEVDELSAGCPGE